MNRNDVQSGWDTDQFPNNYLDVALAYYHILLNGGFKSGAQILMPNLGDNH